ncbi:MAG: putative DNA binding domain-containing protein [Candidatus Accumulibacter sp.]|jgi:ATP-dependent DNA helicase RecG|nr:putative DNA binding domain-containing protein [Accumulibacter sp.]
MTLPINLDDLLRQRTVEGARIEYKAGWNPDAIVRTLCAFANDFENLGGGYVVIGQNCDADGRPVFPPVGLATSQLDKIQRELLAHCQSIQPSYFPVLSLEVVEGRSLIVLWAPGGQNRPYKAPESVTARKKTWHYYVRRYSSTVEAKDDTERELLSLAAKVPFDDRYNQSARIADLSLPLMCDFLREVGSALAEETAPLSAEALGRQMNVAGGPAESPWPKNAGLLFFNEMPERFFPYTQIDVLWFPEGAGGDRFDEKTFKGPLARMTREALSYIQRNYLFETVIKYPDRAEATRVWNFPYAAIEEAVVNAVYHRSYEEREPIEIRISYEELVVISFPGPDRSIRLEDLQAGRAISRRYRNRRIGEFLKELDLAEGRSTGIPKILKEMAANGSPPPTFETDDERSSFIIRLLRHPLAKSATTVIGRATATEQAAGRVAEQVAEYVTGQATEQDTAQDTAQDTEQDTAQATEQATEQDTAQDTEQDTEQVTEGVRRLLRALTGEMSRQQLLDALALSHREHFRSAYLKPALEAGLVEMALPDKPSSGKQRYRLTLEGRQWLDGQAETST